MADTVSSYALTAMAGNEGSDAIAAATRHSDQSAEGPWKIVGLYLTGQIFESHIWVIHSGRAESHVCFRSAD